MLALQRSVGQQLVIGNVLFTVVQLEPTRTQLHQCQIDPDGTVIESTGLSAWLSVGDTITLGSLPVTCGVIKLLSDRVRLAIDSPPNVRVDRKEVWDKLH